MSFGSHTYGGSSYGGRQPAYRTDVTLTTFTENIKTAEHLNIKYRKILTFLWSRQEKQPSHGFLLVDSSNFLVTEDGTTIMTTEDQFDRQDKQNSSWNKQDRNE